MLDRQGINLVNHNRDKDCDNCNMNDGHVGEIYNISRRQDAMCVFLFGKTLNGGGPMNVEPTEQSWCGQIKAQVDKIPGLEKRIIYGTGFIVGMGFVLNWLMKFIKW